ncbi:hypothetical protein [Synechococcus sp. CS-1326]|uniref:hypothetical protein n=1 Tax=Synechococcus sp. CS-1326 TaxID=2847978 RepID=UPI00223BD18A|nr:hypothetical protein [Synechococcus sp. CS-1326]
MIWVEFTKLSRHREWDSEHGRKDAGSYSKFEESNQGRSYNIEACLKKATGGKPAASSIPETLKDAFEVLAKFEALKKTLYVSGLFGGVLAIIALLLPTWTLINDAHSSIDSKSLRRRHSDEIQKLEADVERLRLTIRKMEIDMLTIKRPVWWLPMIDSN